jgi:hypothetical protein
MYISGSTQNQPLDPGAPRRAEPIQASPARRLLTSRESCGEVRHA